LCKEIDDSVKQTLPVGKDGSQYGEAQEHGIAEGGVQHVDGGFVFGEFEQVFTYTADLQEEYDGEKGKRNHHSPTQQDLFVHLQGGYLGDDQKWQGDIKDDPGDAGFYVPLDDVEFGGHQSDQGKDEQDKDLLNDDVYFHGLH